MRLIVLNDDDTFSDAKGAFLCEVPDHYDTEDIEAALKERRTSGYDPALRVIATFEDEGMYFS